MTADVIASAHLTEIELDLAFLGEAPAGASAHLAACHQCSMQLEEFRSHLAGFNQATSAWSEARSNALDRDLKLRRSAFRVTLPLLWTCASALGLVVAASVSIGLHTHHQGSSASTATMQRLTPTNLTRGSQADTKIASDDAMLRQIDAAIDTAEPSPEDIYKLKTSGRSLAQDSDLVQVPD